MHVHDYEKLWLFASVLLIVAFVSTIVYGALGAGITMVDDEGGQVNPDDLGNETGFDDPGVRETGPDEYDVYVVALQFGYLPSEITLPAGSTVTFHVTSRDVVHGFEIVGTNANTMVLPGQVAEITVRFDEPGEYGVVCNEFCGDGHHDMYGTLNVVPESEFSLQDGSSNATADGANATTGATQTGGNA